MFTEKLAGLFHLFSAGRARHYPRSMRRAVILIGCLAALTSCLAGLQPGSVHAATPACSPANTAPSGYVQTILADHPRGYWRLDEAAGSTCLADSSGNGLNGTSSAAGLTFHQAGAPLGDGDTAVTFDGRSGYVSLGDPTGLQPAKLSVEAWIATTHPGGTILRKRLYGYNLALNANGTPVFGITTIQAMNSTTTGTTSLADGKWHHLVGTYDGSQVCLYVDGAPAASCTSAGIIAYQADLVAIGRDGGAGSGYFTGSIDDVAFYDTVLSAGQVQAHFGSAQAPRSCSPSPATSTYSGAVLADKPLGYWRLDETCKGVVSDRGRHGMNGIAFGNVTPNQMGAPLGDTDTAMAFDGAGSYITLGDAAALQPAKLSVEAWINTGSTNEIILRKRMDGYVLKLNPDGLPVFGIDDRNGAEYDAAGATSLSDKAWHYLAGTYDGSQVCLYVDGAPAGNCRAAGTIAYLPDQLAIGRDGGMSDGYFSGSIDEVAIYGSALSATQVQTHYNAAASRTGTTTSFTISPATIVPGQPFTLTARVHATSGTPTGTVQFNISGHLFASSPLINGTASIGIGGDQTSQPTPGSLPATFAWSAVYAGDATHLGSSSATSNLVVGKFQTTTTVRSSADPSVVGAAVTFTAAVQVVAPGTGTPTGTVTFLNGTTVIGTGTLNNGTATVTNSSASTGIEDITAIYSGDGNYGSSGTAAPLAQVIGRDQTTITVTSNFPVATQGASFAFSAAVQVVAPGAGSPTGTVTFRDGTTVIGTGTLAAGVATLRISNMAPGKHSITASYGGDNNHLYSTSAILIQIVAQHS